MAARNPITGDLIQTKANTAQYQQNLVQIFGDRKPQRGRYKQDPETRKFIPAHEWQAKYGREKLGEAPLMFMSHFEAYESPATGRVIQNKREHLYDLDASGCRVYEGREQEQKEANKYRQEQDRKFEARIDETLHQTAYDIEHGYLTPREA